VGHVLGHKHQAIRQYFSFDGNCGLRHRS
jgi:hypothetical protein